MIKRIIAASLTLSKVSLLVLLSSMNLWGNSAMAMDNIMPCAEKSAVDKCEICTIAVENLSEPFIQKSSEKELTKKNPAKSPIPIVSFVIEEPFLDLNEEEIIFPPPKLLSKNSYLFAKKKIVLIV